MPEKTRDQIPDLQGSNAGGARGLGADLRAKREELGWALPDVAGWLHIREGYLLALEEGDTCVFPGSAYALGFLRTYAQALGVDPDQAVARYRMDMRGAFDQMPALSFPAASSERGLPLGFWVGAGLAVLIGTYIGYYHFFGVEQAPTHHVPPVIDVMPGVTQHGTTSPQIAAVMPDRDLAPSAQLTPALPSGAESSPQVQTETFDAMSSKTSSESSRQEDKQTAPRDTEIWRDESHGAPSSDAALLDAGSSAETTGSLVKSSVPAPVPDGAGSTPSLATATPPPATSADRLLPVPADRIVLHAQSDAWVSINDKNGAAVFKGVLKSGDSWQGSEDAAPYRMTLGNAGALTLSAGDVTTAALGRMGRVRHSLVVTSQAIREGQIGSDTVVQPAISPSAGGSFGMNNTQPNGDKGISQKSSSTTSKLVASESESEQLNARQLQQIAQPR